MSALLRELMAEGRVETSDALAARRVQNLPDALGSPRRGRYHNVRSVRRRSLTVDPGGCGGDPKRYLATHALVGLRTLRRYPFERTWAEPHTGGMGRRVAAQCKPRAGRGPDPLQFSLPDNLGYATGHAYICCAVKCSPALLRKVCGFHAQWQSSSNAATSGPGTAESRLRPAAADVAWEQAAQAGPRAQNYRAAAG